MDLDPIYVTPYTNYWIYVIIDPLWNEILERRKKKPVVRLTSHVMYQINNDDIIFVYVGKSPKVGFVGYGHTSGSMIKKKYELYNENNHNAYSFPLSVFTIRHQPQPISEFEDIITKYGISIAWLRVNFFKGYLSFNQIDKVIGKEMLQRMSIHEIDEIDFKSDASKSNLFEEYNNKSDSDSDEIESEYIGGTMTGSSILSSDISIPNTPQRIYNHKTSVQDDPDSEDEIDQLVRKELNGKLIDDDISTESEVDSDDQESVGNDEYAGNDNYALLTDSDPREGTIPIMVIPQPGYTPPKNTKHIKSSLISGLKSGHFSVINNNHTIDLGFWLTNTKNIKLKDDSCPQFDELLASYLHNNYFPITDHCIYRIKEHGSHQGCYLVTISR